jgi:hypothetical protein
MKTVSLAFLCIVVFAFGGLGQQAPETKQSSPEEDPNVQMLKYDLNQNIETIKHPDRGGVIMAVQKLANMKSRAAQCSLLRMFKQDSIPPLEQLLKVEGKVLREEAALALKRIRDDAPYPKVTNGTHWVQVVEIERGGNLGTLAFRPTDSSNVLLEVTFNTDDPSITSENLSKEAGKYCEVLYSDSSEPRQASFGGGNFSDPMGIKICGFAVPQQARGLKFKVLGFPEADLKF